MSTKVAKKKFVASKEKGERILGILNGKKGSVDITEFANTLKFVNSVLEDYVKSKDKERPVVADDGSRIESLLKDYEDLIVQLVNTQRFLRFFTSNRVRKKLDQINTQLHKEASEVYLGLQENKKKQSRKSTKKPLKASDGIQEKQTDCIKDDDGKTLWENQFDQTLMVEWPKFIEALRPVVPIDEETEKQLLYILDNSNTGYVSMYKFADFLNGFGPLKLCVSKVQAVLNSEWFHGFLSSAEAERLLERQAPGTYLIRFSKSKAGSFAIAYVDSNQRHSVTHTLIICCPPSGFKIEEAYNTKARGRLFVSLNEVVEFYGYLLKTPFKSDLSRQSWFHGDLTTPEAEEILAGESEGTFLFRFSSKSGFLAVSYVSQSQIKHGLLEALPGGYRFENNPPIYPTLQDVVDNLQDFLKRPLSVLTYASLGSKNANNNLLLPHHLRKENMDNNNNNKPGPASEYISFQVANNSFNNSVLSPQRTSSPGPVRTSPPNSMGSNSYVPTQPQPSRSPGGTFSNSPHKVPSTVVVSDNYGTMPVISSQNGDYTGFEKSVKNDYGEAYSVEESAFLNNNNSGSNSANSSANRLPSVISNASQNSEYGGMPNIPNGGGSNQYGEMPIIPNSNSQPPSKNAYSKVPSKAPENRPKSLTTNSQLSPSVPLNSSGTIFGAVNTSSTSNNNNNNYARQTSEYGAMPDTLVSNPKNTVSMSTSPSNNNNNNNIAYGRMPNAPSVSSPSSSSSPPQQYGKIPNPVSSSSSGSNNSVTQNNSVAPNPNNHYGKINGTSGPSNSTMNTPPVKHIPPSTTPVTNSTPNNNYGAIPASLMRPGVNSSPSQSPRPQSPSVGKFASPPPVSNNNNNNSPLTYGKIPAPSKSASMSKTSSPVIPNKAPYGKVPPKNGNVKSEENGLGIDSDYGGLPPMGSQAQQTTSPSSIYGNMNAIELDGDYGSLPIENKSQFPQDNDDYGGLPESNPNFALNNRQNQYASMPNGRDFQVDEDYQDLPPT